MATEVRSKDLQGLKEEIERKTGKTPEQLYEEREKRVRDAIELKEPDRVPVVINPNPGIRAGLPEAAAYYDPIAWKEAIRDEALYYETDLASSGFANSGATWEALDVLNRRWPGGTLPPDIPYQFVEGEWMKAEEYDLFLKDPSDFVVRFFLPRVYGALLPMAKLPPLSLMFTGFDGIAGLFATPEFEQLAKNLHKAGQELQKHRQATGDAQEELAQLGFPAFSNAIGAVGGASRHDGNATRSGESKGK